MANNCQRKFTLKDETHAGFKSGRPPHSKRARSSNFMTMLVALHGSSESTKAKLKQREEPRRLEATTANALANIVRTWLTAHHRERHGARRRARARKSRGARGLARGGPPGVSQTRCQLGSRAT